MMCALGFEGERKAGKFEIVLTHDIDNIRLSPSWRGVLGDIVKRMDIRSAWFRVGEFFKDPTNTYSFLMDVSERVGVQSRFHFMAVKEKVHEKDTPYYLHTRKFKRVARKIRACEHVIGFHPGYGTYRDERRWQTERQQLEAAVGEKITEGRQHYLRVELPYTLAIWEKQGMAMDSSLSYADREGFRCGTGDCFHYFDFLQREKLNLVECPLIVMDGTLHTYRKLSPDEAEGVIRYYLACGKKYGMPITLLFHNTSFNYRGWRGWKRMYKRVLSEYFPKRDDEDVFWLNITK